MIVMDTQEEVVIDLADRVMKDVPPIQRHPLPKERLWTTMDGKEVPNVAEIRKFLLGEGII